MMPEQDEIRFAVALSWHRKRVPVSNGSDSRWLSLYPRLSTRTT